MSQEVRVPLNTIDGFSQIIMESDDIDSIKEDANDIRVASKNLIDIINGLIDISIIESGKLEIINENYNVYDMFDNIVNIINSRLNDSDVKFIVNIDKDIPKVLFGDAERIEQILLNILMNAIKHTTKGQIRLDITSIKTSNKCRLKIKISDTGVGIKKENIEKLFDNSNYINSNSSGYGLGLIISKQLLDLMEGEIDVSSIYGEGSTFIVTIDQKIATDNNLVINTKERKVKPISLMGKRILVVDDNKLNIKVATKLLSPYKVEIKDAYSGQECLDILDKDNDFDLILMDDMMPHMSGTETLDILKKIERIEGYSIPVVVLTANAVTGMKNKYLASGFDDYLAKPIDRGELDRVLRKFLKDKKG
jgi:CheY-like chemotaxis protein